MTVNTSVFCAYCGGHMEEGFPEPRCWKCGGTTTSNPFMEKRGGTMRHTSGPWIVSGFLGTGLDYDYVNADGPQAVARICVPVSHPNIPDPRAECAANARLIAAAPDLLEALLKMTMMTQQHPRYGEDADWDNVVEAGRAALEKAVD